MSQRRDDTAGETGKVTGRKTLVAHFLLFGAFCLFLYLLSRNSGDPLRWSSLYLLYMSFPCTFVPLPVNPVVIGMGRTYSPLLVALLGALGTSVANLNEYQVLGAVSGSRFARKIKEGRVYTRMVEWYRKHPFLLLAATNFLPIPVDPVRWLSISSGYARPAYAAASFVGRAPRYYLLALLGDRYKVSNEILLVLVAVPVVYSGARFLVRRLSQGKN
jgi:membrane protein YqaA with SNARE-associated domain